MEATTAATLFDTQPRFSAVVSDDASGDQSGSDSDEADDDQDQNQTQNQSRNITRKRKRPMNVTCEACKHRKVKCDRVRPACGWCARNDHVCEYKERKKPGLRAGYGRELETRLDRLEAIIREQGRQLTAHLQGACSIHELATDVPSVSNGADLTTANRISTYSGPNLSAALATSQLIDPKLRSPPAFNREQPSHYAASIVSDLSHPQQPLHEPSPVPAHSLTSPYPNLGFQRTLEASVETSAPLPPYDLVYSLVDLYFKHIHVWFPLLDRKSTLDTFFGQTPLVEADKVLLHAIVATSLRFSEDYRLTHDSRLHYHTTSKQKVQLFGIENSSVRSLQALVIMALDVTGTANGPPGWNMLSLISRSVVQMGLAAEPTSSLIAPSYPSIATLRATLLPESRSCIEDEERRRLFWCVFLLDRYATVATAFEFAVDEKEIDRRLPCRDDLFSANRPVETRWFRSSDRPQYNAVLGDIHGHFAYHCELLVILGRIHQFLKRPVDIGSVADVEQWQDSYRTLDGDLNAWHFNLPDDFSNITRLFRSSTAAKPSQCGWIVLHAAHCLTMIRLNSSAAYPSQTSPLFTSSYSAMQRCLTAVENLKHLIQLVMSSALLDKVGPPFAFAAWVAARVMLVHGSTTDHEVDPDIGFFVSLLTEMGHHWKVALRYSDILGRVLEEYRASQRAGMAERVTPSTVKILADMRRCAFDLDLLISRQPSLGARPDLPSRASSPQPNELEYLDVFDLFNFPRMPLLQDSLQHPNQGSGVGHAPPTDLGSMNNSLAIPNFAVPNPEADWLFHAA